MHIRIVQGHQTIADLPEWEGPVPSRGDYLFHPPQRGEPDDPGSLFQVAGCVATVTWRMYERPRDPGATEFSPTSHPYVEITLGS